MPLPKRSEIEWVTVDCYGTLIDWDKGITEAFEREANEDGLTLDMKTLLPRFYELQYEVMGGSYELYAEVLRRAAVKAAGEIGWSLEPSRAQFLPDSIGDWQPFRESNAAMDRLQSKYNARHRLQHRRQAARHLAPPPAHRARPRRHRPAGPLLQARARPLQGVRAPDRQEEGLGPHHQRPLHRRRAADQDARPRDLDQPPRREAREAAARSRRAEVKNLRDAAKKLGC